MWVPVTLLPFAYGPIYVTLEMAVKCLWLLLNSCVDWFTFQRCYNIHERQVSDNKSAAKNFCVWCSAGISLICCDECPAKFCKTCIRRNFGRPFLQSILDSGMRVAFLHLVYMWLILLVTKQVSREYYKHFYASACLLAEDAYSNWPVLSVCMPVHLSMMAVWQMHNVLPLIV